LPQAPASALETITIGEVSCSALKGLYPIQCPEAMRKYDILSVLEGNHSLGVESFEAKIAQSERSQVRLGEPCTRWHADSERMPES